MSRTVHAFITHWLCTRYRGSSCFNIPGVSSYCVLIRGRCRNSVPEKRNKHIKNQKFKKCMLLTKSWRLLCFFIAVFFWSLFSFYLLTVTDTLTPDTWSRVSFSFKRENKRQLGKKNTVGHLAFGFRYRHVQSELLCFISKFGSRLIN